jgi:hypothetical protein
MEGLYYVDVGKFITSAMGLSKSVALGQETVALWVKFRYRCPIYGR